ncbi:MAG: FprA family A-type flavoprotein [Muribaculaceae bacterium]|nr:FprA family A-type flavoprotein [Muribaculaceae bacterium]
MNINEITGGVHYVGVNDRTTDLFEGLWIVPLGVSYNAYVVLGTERTALIDTVDAAHAAELEAKVQGVLRGRALDYIIVNHVEQDHSSALPHIHLCHPQAAIVGNAKTAAMLTGYYGLQEVTTVADGDTIDLGGKTLQFHLTPMLHWPETMMTRCVEDKVLFSGDAFGCFGALNGAVVDRDMNTGMYWNEMYRYYGSIVAKYGVPVKNALKKLEGVELDYICSTHGPVWHDELSRVVATYAALADWQAQPGVVIAYASMHGNVTLMAEHIASELASNGVKNVLLQDLNVSNLSYVLMNIGRFNGLVIGGNTYNTEIHPRVAQLLGTLKMDGIQHRTVGLFGNYTWSPGVTKKMAAALEGLKIDLLDPVEFKQAPATSDLEAASNLARELAARVLA